jgi:predicted regulator of Ras-like GTPase activity (Roadblock/LC7/MglB family)
MAMATAPETSKALQIEIQKIEAGTDLKRVAVISRIGMKIADAASSQMDADAETASSSALVELAERLMSSLNHGHLREIVVKADSGFVILQFINQEYMLFGGVENPLRIGFYLEYLRSTAHRFAYILAGNQLTEELKSEIELNNRREARLKQEAKAPLAANFKMDKNTSQDMEAMEGVLQFLQDWGGEESTQTPASTNNIVGIDKDLMFGMEGMESLEPQPISQDQISQAQHPQFNENVPATSSQPDAPFGNELEDIANLADELQGIGQKETQQVGIASEKIESTSPTSSSSEEGLPEDILAVLDDIAQETTAPKTPKVSQVKDPQPQKFPYGIPIYEGEVPPVPLKSYVNFEIGSLGTQDAHGTPGPQISGFSSDSQIASNLKPVGGVNYKTELKVHDDGTPDFDAMSSEYDDDINLDDDDTFLKALEEINSEKRKRK